MEDAIFQIFSLKQNSKLLVIELNRHWTSAALGAPGLDIEKIIRLASSIRKHAASILEICQAHPNFEPWQESRKRHSSTGNVGPCKLKKLGKS